MALWIPLDVGLCKIFRKHKEQLYLLVHISNIRGMQIILPSKFFSCEFVSSLWQYVKILRNYGDGRVLPYIIQIFTILSLHFPKSKVHIYGYKSTPVPRRTELRNWGKFLTWRVAQQNLLQVRHTGEASTRLTVNLLLFEPKVSVPFYSGKVIWKDE